MKDSVYRLPFGPKPRFPGCHIKLINQLHISIFIPVLLFKGPDAQSILRRTTMDHENREAQQISALELQLKSNFQPGLRFPSYLYDFSASKQRFFVRACAWGSVPFFLVHLAPIFGCRFKHVSRNCPYKCPENPEADLFVLVQG